MGKGVLPRRIVTRSPDRSGTWTWPSMTSMVESPSPLGRDLVDLVGAVDQGALGERVRADRGDDEHVGVGWEDRPPRRETVGRRADRGGDDQAITAIGHDAFAVDRQADVDQVEDRGRPDDGVVETAEWPSGADVAG